MSNKKISQIIESSIRIKESFLSDESMIREIQTIIIAISKSLKNGGKILLCGNGGSAADAQHIAAEFTGRFYKDRPPLFAEALHVNTSYLTAVANDYSYEEVYSRLVMAKGVQGDILIAISTSGSSKNILKAVKVANKLGLVTISFTGNKGGLLSKLSKYNLIVDSEDTPRIQECHILMGHIICELVESNLFD